MLHSSCVGYSQLFPLGRDKWRMDRVKVKTGVWQRRILDLKEFHTNKIYIFWYLFHQSIVDTVPKCFASFWDCINNGLMNQISKDSFWGGVYFLTGGV